MTTGSWEPLLSSSSFSLFFLQSSSRACATRALYAHLYASIFLGYYISPTKSTIVPTQSMVHLGFGIDSRNSSFSITDKYRAKFRKCRRDLLERRTANLLDLQRWVGKCNHLRLVFPANSLFTFEARRHMASLQEERLPLPTPVLEEIAFWTFVDSFTEPVPFLLQQHVSLRLYTDASGYAWGASIDLPSGPLVLRDYWSSPLLGKDICAKEALAVLFCLQAIEDRLYCRRVDVFVDNEGLFHAWSGLKANSPELVGVLQSLFLLTLDLRLSLRLHWVPTDRNPADAPSRALSRSDSMLSPALRRKIWAAYGPLAHDLMALPSNVFRDPSGTALPFFSRFPVPSAAGVNVFVQPPPGGRLYAFPPFGIITPVLRLFMEWGGVEVVLVLPVFPRVAAWSQLLRPFVQDSLPLFSPASSMGALLFPSSAGFSENLLPLRFGLTAYRCVFPARSPPPASPVPAAFRVLVIGDSVLRPLLTLSWPAPLRVILHSLSGAPVASAVAKARALASVQFDALLLHAGVNDASRACVDWDARLDEVGVSLRSLASSLGGRCLLVSTVCQSRCDDINTRVAPLNRVFREGALRGDWALVSNDNIRFHDLSDDVHLNAAGTARLFRNFCVALKAAAVGHV